MTSVLRLIVNRLIAYLWPLSTYHDASCGSMLERAAALRHNCQLAIDLPAYINRWAVLAVSLLLLMQLAPPPLGQLLGVLFTVVFCGFVHLLYVWAAFKRLS